MRQGGVLRKTAGFSGRMVPGGDIRPPGPGTCERLARRRILAGENSKGWQIKEYPHKIYQREPVLKPLDHPHCFIIGINACPGVLIL
jgi:hypothetical protein